MSDGGYDPFLSGMWIVSSGKKRGVNVRLNKGRGICNRVEIDRCR